MHMGIFSGRESPLSWPNESRTSWDMGPHEDAHFLCLDGAVALATTSKLAVYRFQLHLQALEEGWKCTEFER